MWEADDLADAVAADEFAGGSATTAVRTALADGIGAVLDAPASLRALFAFLDTEPD